MLKQLLRNLFASRRVQPIAASAGHSTFYADLAARMAAGAQTARLDDNVDLERWASLTEEGRRALAARLSAECLELLLAHGALFEKADALLADEASRDLYRSLLCYRVLGAAHVRLPIDTKWHWAKRGDALRLRTGDSAHASVFGPLSSFSVQFQGETLVLDAWPGNIAWTYLLKQYWFARGTIEVMPQSGDCIIDAGACFGDTTLAFAASTGPKGSVHAFEIDPSNLRIAADNFSRNPNLAKRIRLNALGLGRESATLYLNGSGPGAQLGVHPGGLPVEVVSLDDYARIHCPDKVDFIKMDIEGAEMGALKGARETLKRHRPRLAISVYHQTADLMRIPLWLDDLGLGYRLWLDHYTIHHEETILYAAVSGPLN